MDDFIVFEVLVFDRLYDKFGYEPEEIKAANIKFAGEKSLHDYRVRILEETKRMIPINLYPKIFIY